jgi:hypothetical protein
MERIAGQNLGPPTADEYPTGILILVQPDAGTPEATVIHRARFRLPGLACDNHLGMNKRWEMIS